MTDEINSGRLLPFNRRSLHATEAQPTITVSLEHLLHLFDAFASCAQALHSELDHSEDLTEKVSRMPGRNELGLRRSVETIRQEKAQVAQVLVDLKAMQAEAQQQADDS